MAKVRSGEYRAKSKMVHIDCLFSLEQTAMILKESKKAITQGHRMKTLPFVSFDIGNTPVFYIPASAIRALDKVQKLGVTKTLDFYRSIKSNRLERLFEENINWDSYNLNEWK